MSAEPPKLRSGLEAVPVRHGGSMYVAIRDLEGLSPETLLLTPQAYFIVVLLDGSNSFVDMQAAYMRKFGELLFREDVDSIIKKLDEHLFLENDRSLSSRQQLITQFRNQTSRSAYHAGGSYDSNPDRLRTQLHGFFAKENEGPGEPEIFASKKTALGLMAPHIDLRSGGPCFAYAYKALVEASPIDTCLILGTGHEFLPNYFALSRKDFETPLGPVAADNDFIDELTSRCSLDLFADEFAHRREHTIEFQTLFLRLLLPKVRIVPILCSFGVDEVVQRHDAICQMVTSLKETIRASSQAVCLLASVDLAHIGPRYGDPFRPHSGTVRETKDADHQLLQTMEAADAEAFANVLAGDGNSRRICGLPPLYVMLKTLQGAVKGELLKYDHTEVDGEHSFVSFASMAFYQTAPL